MSHARIILEAVNISRRNQLILANLSLRLEPGEHLLITGPSGSGKTSLALAIAGQLYASGKIQLNYSLVGLAAKVCYISQFYKFKNRVGLSEFYYQQRYNSYDNENAPTIREVLAAEFSQHPEKMADLISMFALEQRLDAPLIQLSSGERKKIQLICNLVDPAQIILLDNPYIGLDSLAVTSLNNFLLSLTEAGANIIIFADAGVIPNFISHIAVIQNKHLQLIPRADYVSEVDITPATPLIIQLPVVNAQFSNIIKMNQVNISYGGNKILDTIDWEVLPGEKWLIVGANGAGKSTLISLINGDNPQAYANDLYLFDRKRGSGETIWEIKRNIGYISPELQWNFDGSMTCVQAVCSGYFDTPGLYRQASAAQLTTAEKLLESLGISEFKQLRFADTPNGIQRLVLLARALIKNPPLLIFDEPCQGLDEHQAHLFVELVDALFADNLHTLIYVSHRPDQIPRCINKVLRLDHGKVQAIQDVK